MHPPPSKVRLTPSQTEAKIMDILPKHKQTNNEKGCQQLKRCIDTCMFTEKYKTGKILNNVILGRQVLWVEMTARSRRQKCENGML